MASADEVATYYTATKAKPIEDQVDTFLRAFSNEYDEQVFLQIHGYADEWEKKYERKTFIESFDAMQFVKKLDLLLRGPELTQHMTLIDPGNKKHIALIDCLCIKFGKLPKDIVAANPDKMLEVPMDDVMAALQEHRNVFQNAHEKAQRVAQLIKLVELGGKEAAAAKVELYQIQTANPDTEVESEMAAVRKRLGAAKLVKEIGTENFLDRRKYETEKQKLKQAGALKDLEAQQKRKASESKIQRRGKNWQNED